MSARLVSIIYFYLVSILGLVLLIVGIYNGVSYIVNTTQYDEYPLRYGGIERCDYFSAAPEKPIPADTSMASVSAEDRQRQEENCKKNLAYERKQHKVDDLKNALTFTLIGTILLGIHFPIALRRSNVPK